MRIDSKDYFFAAEPVGTQAFVLLRPKSVTKSQLTPFVEALLISALAAGALAAVAAFGLARRIARPVVRVADAARSLARGTHPEPVPVEGAAELATLAQAFNDLATQLAQAREAERNFLLSVSHELKTPLTAIRGYAEALRDGAVSVQDATETVALESARLERLVGDLLDLARMNRTDFSVHNSEIDLARSPTTRCAATSRRQTRSASRSPRSPTASRPRSPTPTACSRSCRTSSRTRSGSRRSAARSASSLRRGFSASRTRARG